MIPISTVSEKEIRTTATVNLETLLNTSPQFIAANTVNSRVGPGVATLDLRGLGANRTLVLVDGRRFIPYDQNLVTDINAIPSQFVERVDVVTGGSSAVYGSDAVAGVVNFILRKDFEGLELFSQYRVYGSGDGATLELGVAAGGAFANNRGRAMLSINRVERGRVSQTERDYAIFYVEGVDAQGRPALVEGGPLSSTNGRFSGIPTGAALNNPANAGLRTALDAAGLLGISSLGFTFDPAGTTARPYNPSTDFLRPAAFMALQQPQQRWAVNGLVTYDVTDRLSTFAQFAFSSNRTQNSSNPDSVTGNYEFDVDNPYLSAEVQEVLRQLDLLEGAPNGRATLSINKSIEEIGSSTTRFDRDAFQIVVGGGYDLGDVYDGWLKAVTFDWYYSFAESNGRSTSENQTNIERFRAGLLRGPDGSDPLINIFGATISDEALEAIRLNPTSINNTRQQTLNISANGTLFALPAGSVQGAFGGEWRRAEAVFRPDELQRLGVANPGEPIPATDGSIDVLEAFGEVRVPVLSDQPFFEDLTLHGAFRYSSYDIDAVGGVWTYFGGVEWRPINSLLIRSQYQRAIRAPNVAELFGGQRPSNPVAADPCAQASALADPTIRDLCVATGVPLALIGTAGVQPAPRVDSISGGNPNLTAEDARTFTVGTVFTPDQISGLQLSVDYFRINVADAISPLAGGTASILNLCYNVIQRLESPVCAAINRNPADGTIVRPFRVQAVNQNIGELEVKGYDFGINYGRALSNAWFIPDGNLSIGLQGTYYTASSTTPVQDLPDQVNRCVGAFGSICGEPFPKLRTNTRVSYSTGPVEVSLRHRYIGEVTLDQVVLPRRAGNPGPSASDFASGFIGAQQYIDLSVNYRLSGGATIVAGVNNVFDRDPPIIARNFSEFFTFPSTYDPLGRVLFVSLQAKF